MNTAFLGKPTKSGDGWFKPNPYQRGPAAENAAQEEEEELIILWFWAVHSQKQRTAEKGNGEGGRTEKKRVKERF